MATTAAQQLLNASGGAAGEQLPEHYWELIARYRSELLNQALSIVGSLEDAEDTVQETLCEAVRNASGLTAARSIGSWLRAINRANALNRLRGKRTQAKHAGQKQRVLPSRMVTTGGINVLEMRESVAKAIENLPPELRAVVVLRYWEDLSYEEIASRTQIAPMTVRRRLYEAALQLHSQLQPVLRGVPPAASTHQGSTEPPAGSRE